MTVRNPILFLNSDFLSQVLFLNCRSTVNLYIWNPETLSVGPVFEHSRTRVNVNHLKVLYSIVSQSIPVSSEWAEWALDLDTGSVLMRSSSEPIGEECRASPTLHWTNKASEEEPTSASSSNRIYYSTLAAQEFQLLPNSILTPQEPKDTHSRSVMLHANKHNEFSSGFMGTVLKRPEPDLCSLCWEHLVLWSPVLIEENAAGPTVQLWALCS